MEKGILYDFDQMISVETFKLYSGKDLKWEFENEDNAENAPDLFLCDTQQFLVDYVKRPIYDNSDFDDLINSEEELNNTDRSSLSEDDLIILDFQIKRIKLFKRAIFHQAYYFLMNGQKYLSDGFDRTTKTITDFSNIVLSPRAEQCLRDGAFLNVKRSSSNVRYPYFNGGER